MIKDYVVAMDSIRIMSRANKIQINLSTILFKSISKHLCCEKNTHKKTNEERIRINNSKKFLISNVLGDLLPITA